MSSAIVQTTNSKSYSGFNPRSIPSCGLWLDGADPNGTGSVTNASSISTWVDKSGNSRNATNQATAGIAYTNILNGRSVMRLSGSSYLVTYTSFPVSAYTIFGVQFLNTNATAYASIIMGGGASVGKFFMGVGGSGTNILTVTGTSAGWNDLDEGSPGYGNYNAWRVVSMVISGSALNPYVDGNAQSAKTGTTGASIASLRVGSSYNGDQNWSGDCAEVLIYESALTSSQRQQVEGYLAEKWGLRTNMPATHPFKSLPVFTRPFQPTDIDKCVLWLDAADRSTFTLSGTTITQWRDKSGNADTTSGGTFNTTGTLGNSLSTMTLSNASFTTTNATGISGASPQTTIAIAKVTSNSSDTFLIVQRTTGGNAGGSMTLSVRQGVVFTDVFQVANGPSVSVTPSGRTTMGMSMHTGSSWTIYECGTAGSVIANTLNQPASARIFAQISPGTAEIGEIIVFNKSLSNTERQQIEGYLAWKWNLQGNLSSTQPFRLFRTPSVLTNPLQISNCYMWIDALDSASVTLSGNNVTGALDKSGNGRHLTSGSGYTYNQTKFKSIYPSFYNAGASPNNIGKNTSFTLAQPITFFILGQMIYNGAVEPYPFMFDGPDGVGRIGPYWASSTQLAYYAGGSSLTYNGTFTDPFIFCFVANSPSSQIIYNSALVNSGNPGSSSLNGIILGSRFNGSTYTGHICEFIMYNKVCTTSEIKQIEGYLAWKWGLQRNLLTSHPYYNTSS